MGAVNGAWVSMLLRFMKGILLWRCLGGCTGRFGLIDGVDVRAA